MSLIVISVDNSSVAGGKQRGRLASKNMVNNSINKKTSERYTQFSALVCDFSTI